MRGSKEPTTLKSIRLPNSLIEEIDREAGRRKLTFTDIVIDRCRSPLAPVEDQLDMEQPEIAPYRCPAPFCTYTAKSKAAVCGAHGRRVVPA